MNKDTGMATRISDKALANLLNYTDKKFPETHFNPLLDPRTAADAAESITKMLSVTSNTRNSILKCNLRKSVIDMTQSLCRNRHADCFPIVRTSKSIDIFLKYTTNKDGPRETILNKYANRKKRRKAMYEELELHRVQNLRLCSSQSVDAFSCDIKLGVALINMKSKESNKTLVDIVRKYVLINADQKLDHQVYEFLQIVWEHESLVIPIELFHLITVKLVNLLETSLLSVSSDIIDCENANEEKISEVIRVYIKNYEIILECCNNFPDCFQRVFYILADVLILSNYDLRIQQVISHILDEIKCKSTTDSLIRLYPLHMNNIVFLLDIDPKDMKAASPALYNLTLKQFLAHKLSDSLLDCIFLLSHFTKWIPHVVCYFNVDTDTNMIE